MTSNLSKGFTDNSITRVDGLVIKTGKCASNELEWYSAYMDKADIPYILGEKDGSLVMKYVERNGELMVDELLTIIAKYRKYDRLNEFNFDNYTQRISAHITGNKLITNGATLLHELSIIDIEPSFAHGDLSFQNIIPSSTGLKLIDPLYCKGIFGSYVIDYAKLLFSLKFYNNDIVTFNYLRTQVEVPDCLIASECVRVSTYKKQFSFIAENLINEL